MNTFPRLLELLVLHVRFRQAVRARRWPLAYELADALLAIAQEPATR